jgi:hypothetical protein
MTRGASDRISESKKSERGAPIGERLTPSTSQRRPQPRAHSKPLLSQGSIRMKLRQDFYTLILGAAANYSVCSSGLTLHLRTTQRRDCPRNRGVLSSPSWRAKIQSPPSIMLAASSSYGPFAPTVDALLLRAAIGGTVLAGGLVACRVAASRVLSARSSTMIRWSPTL